MNSNAQQYLALGEEYIPRIKSGEQVIDEVITHFDFDKVQTAMKALRWTYVGDPEPPTIEVLRANARTLLQAVLEEREEGLEHQMGGFCASLYPGAAVRLGFTVTSSVAYLQADIPSTEGVKSR